MPFDEEDHILIKNSYRLKGYTSQKMPKEIHVKSWNKRSLQKLLKLKTSVPLTGVQTTDWQTMNRVYCREWSCW